MTNTLTALRNMEGKPAPTVNDIEQKTAAFFKEADTDKNNQISLREFKTYVRKDKQVLEVLMSYGLTKKSDLGQDYGNGEDAVPEIDPDLDEECNPRGLIDTSNAKKQAIKHGGEFEEEELGEGDQAMVNLSGVINA